MISTILRWNIKARLLLFRMMMCDLTQYNEQKHDLGCGTERDDKVENTVEGSALRVAHQHEEPPERISISSIILCCLNNY